MKKFAFCMLFLSIFTFAAFAADEDEVPANFLSTKHTIHANHAGGIHGKGNIPTPHGFPVGVDTLVNFTGHFESAGVIPTAFDKNGISAVTPNHVWEFSMVGNPPEKGGTTTINAPIIAVTMDLRDAKGNPRFVVNKFGKTVPLISRPDAFLQDFLNGPVYGNAVYNSSPVPTQLNDAEQRATFDHKASSDWHTLLAPQVVTPRTMVLNQGTYAFALNADGTCCLFVLVSDPVFSNKLVPPAPADNTTILGAAELAGDMTTKDIATAFFPNVYLFENNDPNQCCVLGFHSIDEEAGDATNGNRTRFFVFNYASWISPGLFGGGFEDVSAHSHEMAEIFNDPFVGFDGIHNITPFWNSGDPQGPQGNQCQDFLEVGDVVEVLPNAIFPIAIGNFTYHPQTIALLPWFAFEKNSSAIDHAYSYPGETELPSLSPQLIDIPLLDALGCS